MGITLLGRRKGTMKKAIISLLALSVSLLGQTPYYPTIYKNLVTNTAISGSCSGAVCTSAGTYNVNASIGQNLHYGYGIHLMLQRVVVVDKWIQTAFALQGSIDNVIWTKLVLLEIILTQ